MGIITKLFGTHSQREIKLIMPLIKKIENLRESMMALSDEQLKEKTTEYKERYAKGESLDSLLPEAYATVREAARRVLNQEHYEVQLIGGIILHQGRIAEMKTGEGKTQTALLPSYLNALSVGKHTLTVIYTDGETSGEFEIIKNCETTTPGTGDSSNIMLWVALLFVSGGMLSAVMYRKKKQAK